MSVELNEFMSGIGLETTKEVRVRGGLTYKQKVINSIKSEIKLIEKRVDLKLLKIKKRIDGEISEVNENRFWKPSNTKPNSVVFNIKVKSKIFGFGEEVDRYSPNYFQCVNDKDELIKKLTQIMEELEKLEINHKFFQLPKKKNEEVKTELVG